MQIIITKENMKKKLILAISISILLLGACKKSSPTTSSGPGGSTNNTSITSSNATSWYGLLAVGKTQNYLGSIMQSLVYNANAYFSSTATNYGNPATVVTVDSVKLNGMPFMYFSSEALYYDTSGFFTGNAQAITYPYTFKIVGNNGIPSFTYIENGPFPSYTGYANIPDTIYKNTGVTIFLTGITNADVVSIDFNDGTSASGHEIGQQLSTPIPASINFSASSMSQFNVTNTAQIEITLNKMDVKNVYGKPMLFSTTYNFTKTLSVK